MCKQMQTRILDGKALAEQILSEIKNKAEQSFAASQEAPALATILVGKDPASASYVRMKVRACHRLGWASRQVELPENTSTEELLEEIDHLNELPQVSGILLQHPVPKQIDERLAFDRIALGKDVDGLSSLGFGRLAMALDSFWPCTPAGILRLLDAYDIPIAGKHAVVVGRSPILGKPAAMLLLLRNATVSICHSHTKDLDGHLSCADIVLAACGRPKLVQGAWLKEGAVVVDAGYHADGTGDVDYDSCLGKAAWISPVPGGVGPMTIAMLLQNTLDAALQQR